MISTHLRNLLSMGGKTETTTAGIIKYEENTRVFSRGMNPTTPRQPPPMAGWDIPPFSNTTR